LERINGELKEIRHICFHSTAQGSWNLNPDPNPNPDSPQLFTKGTSVRADVSKYQLTRAIGVLERLRHDLNDLLSHKLTAKSKDFQPSKFSFFDQVDKTKTPVNPEMGAQMEQARCLLEDVEAIRKHVEVDLQTCFGVPSYFDTREPKMYNNLENNDLDVSFRHM